MISLLAVALAFALGVWVPPFAEATERTNIPLKNWDGFSLFRDAMYDDLERLVTGRPGGSGPAEHQAPQPDRGRSDGAAPGVGVPVWGGGIGDGDYRLQER